VTERVALSTAGQQKETDTDRQTSANIRRALMDSIELSTYAHNIKIITQNGIVTLKGPVRSEEEKSQSRQRQQRLPARARSKA
jgi:osmotically-inducible protein OsmY